MASKHGKPACWPLPIATATFADGQVVRMSVWVPKGKAIDKKRAAALCRSGWQVQTARKSTVEKVQVSEFYFKERHTGPSYAEVYGRPVPALVSLEFDKLPNEKPAKAKRVPVPCLLQLAKDLRVWMIAPDKSEETFDHFRQRLDAALLQVEAGHAAG